jgi:hypothetical protein
MVFDSHGESNGTSSASWVHAKVTICKHKSFLARMFYQNIGPSGVHIFHISWSIFFIYKPGHFLHVNSLDTKNPYPYAMQVVENNHSTSFSFIL